LRQTEIEKENLLTKREILQKQLQWECQAMKSAHAFANSAQTAFDEKGEELDQIAGETGALQVQLVSILKTNEPQ